MLELIVATTLLAAIAAVSMQMLRVAAVQRRANSGRQAALREADNLMERLAGRPWDELTEEGVQDIQISEPVRRVLPDVDLEIEVTSEAEQPDAKRIALSLRWRDKSGEMRSPVRLVAWRYRGIGEPKIEE